MLAPKYGCSSKEMLTPVPPNSLLVAARWAGFTTSQLLIAFALYPNWGPFHKKPFLPPSQLSNVTTYTSIICILHLKYITPSHLLEGSRLLNLPDDLDMVKDSDDNFVVSDTTLQKKAKHLNNVIKNFWHCRVKEYILELYNVHQYPNTQHQSLPALE